MKIAIVASGHYDSALPLVKALRESGNEVTLIITLLEERIGYNGSLINCSFRGFNNGVSCGDSLNRYFFGEKLLNFIGREVKIYFFRFPSRHLKDPRNLIYSYRMGSFLDSLNADIYHKIGANIFNLISSASQKKGGHLIGIHDVIPHSGEARNRLLYQLFMHFSSKGKNRVFFFSEYSKLCFEKIYNPAKRVFYAPFGPLHVYNIFRSGNVKEEDDLILFLGRISEYKGLDYLIRAVRLLNSERLKFKLIIAGIGKIKNMHEIKDIKNIELINRYILNTELCELYQKAAFAILPYTDATQSGVVMTSYAFNKPLIASNVGGIPETVKDGITGLLVPPRDPAALSAAMRELLQNPGKRRKMSENIPEFITEHGYDWGTIAKQTIASYRQVIQGKN